VSGELSPDTGQQTLPTLKCCYVANEIIIVQSENTLQNESVM